MSVETFFYGKLTPEEMFADKVTFSIEDIYLRLKWIKADCFAASKLFTNMDLLRLEKRFGFYSKRFNGQKALSDSTGYNKRFDLEIMGFIEDREEPRSYYRLVVQCKGCEITNSTVAPTPSGPLESHIVKFASAAITQFFPDPPSVNDTPGPKSKWDYRGPTF